MSVELASYARLLEQTALLQEYAAECSIPEIGIPEPNARVYEAMEHAGVFQGFLAMSTRTDADRCGQSVRIVGFAGLLLPIMPHYSKRVATVESIFVTASARKSGIGKELMRSVEEFAKDAGCAAILWSAPTGGKLERLLSARKRYRRTNSVFTASL